MAVHGGLRVCVLDPQRGPLPVHAVNYVLLQVRSNIPQQFIKALSLYHSTLIVTLLEPPFTRFPEGPYELPLWNSAPNNHPYHGFEGL